ncbi:MAG: hypothetical protein HC822_26375 [Oscillochloris sp.]|nr:hypothetical protein [Oscillochloris sp.]
MSEHEQLLLHWVERLRREEPRAVAILCHGSYARDEAMAHSDLDLDVLIAGEPDVTYRSAFAELPDGRLLHATIETIALDEWLEQFAEPEESAAWAFYLAVRQDARLLWATPEAEARLRDQLSLIFPAAAQLQDLIESAAKVRNAALLGDELGLRLAAQDVATRCPSLLALFTTAPIATSRRNALQIALALAPAPPGYHDDMLLCLGLSGRATTIEDVQAAALRLVHGVLDVLRANPGAYEDHVEPGLPEALADGRLQRLLGQP